MTTVTGSYSNYDLSYLSLLTSATLSNDNSTQFTLTASPYTVTVTGSGFTYSGNHPTGGTITGFTVTNTTPGTPLTTTWSSLSVSAPALWNDIATGNITAFNNLLYSGDDTFASAATPGYSITAGAFSGYGGNDTFNMQASNTPDFLSGGDGDDTFNYAGDFNGFTQIDGGAGNNTLNLDGNNGGFVTFGYVTNIQTINLGAGFYYDLGLAPSNNMTVNGSALGADGTVILNGLNSTSALTLLGGAGNNTFILGGNDTFVGGGGTNTVSLLNATGSVTIDLSKTGAQTLGGGLGTDTLSSVEDIIDSNYNDTLIGNAQNNLFLLGTGTDTITGGGGSDTVSFQNIQSVAPPYGVTVDLRSGGSHTIGSDTFTGIDNFIGTAYGDTFIGNSDNNTFDGDSDNTTTPDTTTYQYATSGMTFTETSANPVTLVTTGGGQGTDTLIRMSQIIGSPYDDTFYLLGGYDSLIDGGGGTDTISYIYASSGVNVSLSASGEYSGITNLTGSDYDDQLVGGGTPGIINGGDGDDTLFSRPYYNVGTDGNTLIGGPGTDTAHYYGNMSLYTITHNANGSVTVSNGSNTPDTLWGIEQLQFDDGTSAISMANYPVTPNDFNADGMSDILWQNTNGQAAIWTMNGFTQVGGQPIGGDPGSNWKVVGAADFNGDGMADILWQDTDNGQVVVWTMNGFTQTSSTFIGGAPGAQWKVVATGDFAGNGQEDLVFQNAGGQAVLWTMNATSQTASTFVGGDPGSQWHIVGTGDFNGDGKSDIVWQDSDNGQVVVWTMNGTSQTGSFFVGDAPGSDWKVAGVGDFAGNGQADLLFQNTTTGQPVLWTMSGTTQSASTFIGGNPGPTWHIEGVGDYNGDGKADILWQNDNGQAAVWTMNGAIQLGGSPVGGNPGTSWHIPAGVG